MWYLFFSFLILILFLLISIPFLITINFSLNVVKLKGTAKIKILFWTNEMKFRIKNGYLYMYRNGKEIKEKISTQNVNLKFLLYFAFETYLRQQLHFIEFASSFGYNLDSMVTATVSGGIDVISKSVLSKIKHNKRRANIFTKVEPKYNEDIFNIRAKTCVSNSVFDIVVAFIMAKTRVRREYE